MHFLLTTLKVVYVLTTLMPELLEDATVEAIRIRAKWENDVYICRGHILNGMSDSLFDVYTNVESAKELWDSLESKYMADDSSSKKFLYNELLRILGQYTQHGLKMDESISVSSIIDKLPPSWKDFKHTLKHGKDDLSLVQLGSHLCIEESLRARESDKGKGKEVDGPSVNMIEEGGKNKNNKQNKGKKLVLRITTVVLVPTRNLNWNVGCVAKLVTLRGIVVVETRKITQVLVVREKGLRTNPKTNVDAIAWWINSGATTHVCKDRCGSVALKFSSGKTITLFNVLYVPKLRKNLVSGPLLNKCGYKQVYESDKYILSKCGVFLGFGYYNNGMFMLNLNKVLDDSDSVYMSSSSNVVNSSLWHARLGHVHYKRMLEMYKDDLIPAIDENTEKICGGKEEYVGLDELGEGGNGVVSKIGEFGGDIGSELLGERGGEVLFGGGEGGEGACVFTDRWRLDELAYGIPSDGPYQTNPPSIEDIISSIRIDREGQVRRIRHEEEIDVLEYQILTREIVSTLKPLEEIIRENIFCLGGNRDHVPACLCFMLYCVVHSEKFNLAYYMAKRMEWVTKQARDRSTRRGRLSTSSSTFDQPSSSHLNDDDDDGNDEGTSSLLNSENLSRSTQDWVGKEVLRSRTTINLGVLV
ncbi:zinc finger, CCHC-type containing protein [Tanacetum coccineum]